MRRAWPRHIIVDLYRPSRHSYYILRARGRQWRQLFKNFMQRWEDQHNGTVFFQGEEAMQESMKGYVWGQQLKDAIYGDRIGIKMDPWEFAARLGYDAHELIENDITTVKQLNERYGTIEEERCAGTTTGR